MPRGHRRAPCQPQLVTKTPACPLLDGQEPIGSEVAKVCPIPQARAPETPSQSLKYVILQLFLRVPCPSSRPSSWETPNGRLPAPAEQLGKRKNGCGLGTQAGHRLLCECTDPLGIQDGPGNEEINRDGGTRPGCPGDPWWPLPLVGLLRRGTVLWSWSWSLPVHPCPQVAVWTGPCPLASSWAGPSEALAARPVCSRPPCSSPWP